MPCRPLESSRSITRRASKMSAVHVIAILAATLLSSVHAAVEPCHFSLDGKYQVSVSSKQFTSSANTDVHVKKDATPIIANFEVLYTSACVNGVTQYTSSVLSLTGCGAPDASCMDSCTFRVLAKVKSTFAVSNDGTFDQSTLQVVDSATRSALDDAAQQQLIAATCPAAIDNTVLSSSDLIGLLSILAGQTNTRYESISEQVAVPGTKLATGSDGVEGDEIPLNYAFNTETKVTATATGGVIASQSKYLVPTEDALDANEGHAAPDVGAGEVIRAYYDAKGNLLARSQCTTMQIIAPLPWDGIQDSTNAGQGITTKACSTATYTADSRRRRAQEVTQDEIAEALKQVSTAAPDLDTVYPGEDGYTNFLASYKTDLHARRRARLMEKALVALPTRKLQQADSDGFLTSDTDTLSTDTYVAVTPWSKTFFDSNDTGFVTVSNGFKTGVRAVVKSSVFLKNASTNAKDINIFLVARFDATLSGFFFGADAGILAGYHFIAQANYAKLTGRKNLGKNKVQFRSYLDFPVIKFTAFDDKASIPLESKALGQTKNPKNFKKLGTSKNVTFFTYKFFIVPALLSATFKLQGQLSVSGTAALASAGSGAPILGMGGNFEGALVGIGSADAGLPGLASASVTATVDFVRPTVTPSAGWLIDDLLTMTTIAPTCNNLDLTISGLGITIGYSYTTLFGFGPSGSGTFWSLDAQTLYNTTTGWQCTNTTNRPAVLQADGSDTPASSFPSACSMANSIASGTTGGYITSDPTQQDLTAKLPITAGDPSTYIKPYLPGKTCTWTLNVPAGSYLNLKPSYISLEASDTLAITYPGKTGTRRRLLADSSIGNNVPYSATPPTLDATAGGAVTFTFSSDDTINKNGFLIIYEVTTTPPAGTTTTTYTVVQSFKLAGTTVATFTTAMQADFMAALAGTAGVPSSQVRLTKIVDTNNARRKLNTAGVAVDAQITGLTSQDAANAVAASLYTNGAISAALLAQIQGTNSLAGITATADAPQVYSGDVTIDTGSGSNKKRLAIIVGCAVGGFALLVVLVLVIVLVSRKSSKVAA